MNKHRIAGRKGGLATKERRLMADIKNKNKGGKSTENLEQTITKPNGEILVVSKHFVKTIEGVVSSQLSNPLRR